MVSAVSAVSSPICGVYVKNVSMNFKLLDLGLICRNWITQHTFVLCSRQPARVASRAKCVIAAHLSLWVQRQKIKTSKPDFFFCMCKFNLSVLHWDQTVSIEYTRTCVSALVISAPSWALVEMCPESCAVLGGDVYLVPLLNIFVQNFHSCLNNKLMDLQKCPMLSPAHYCSFWNASVVVHRWVFVLCRFWWPNCALVSQGLVTVDKLSPFEDFECCRQCWK